MVLANKRYSQVSKGIINFYGNIIDLNINYFIIFIYQRDLNFR